ncbi:hypothetical protein L596_011253 [Steinernema carpocapsae]|uniref:Uncharacterized protein n=1 Tax=Steinernema carpocapsae TaxID=34508 RepID=A0A4U5NU73_STECR|nr:hypothetical protein L596_011253 [Steinernema carpocapsae]
MKISFSPKSEVLGRHLKKSGEIRKKSRGRLPSRIFSEGAKKLDLRLGSPVADENTGSLLRSRRSKPPTFDS